MRDKFLNGVCWVICDHVCNQTVITTRIMATKLLRLMTLSDDSKCRTLDLSTPQPRYLHPARSSSHDFSHPLLNSSPSPPSFYLSIYGMQPTTDRPSLWLALSVVTGLPILLWAYKVRSLTCRCQKILCLPNTFKEHHNVYFSAENYIYMGAQAVVILTLYSYGHCITQVTPLPVRGVKNWKRTYPRGICRVSTVKR